MNLQLFWKIALRNLARHRRRNLVTGLAIAFSYCGITLMGAYIYRTHHFLRVNTVYNNHNGSLSIYKKGGLNNKLTRPLEASLSASEQSKILTVLNSMNDVEFVGRYLKGSGLVSNGCLSVPFVGSGIDLEAEKKIRSHPQMNQWTPEYNAVSRGHRLTHYQQSAPDTISVTELLAQTLGKKLVYDEVDPNQKAPFVLNCQSEQDKKWIAKTADVQLATRSFRGDFSVVDALVATHHTTGLHFAEQTGLTAPLPLMAKLFDTDRISYFAVFLHPGASVQKAIDSLRAQLSDLDLEIYPYSDGRVSPFYAGVMQFLFSMATFFYLLILCMIVVTIVNFLTLGIIERRGEIGTFRAIGFEVEKISVIFFRESLALTSAGIASGIVFTLLLSALVNQLEFRFTPPGLAGDMPFLLVPHPYLLLGAALFVGAISLVSAKYAIGSRMKESITGLLRR